MGLTKVAVSDLTNSLAQLNSASSDTSGFVAYFHALASADDETQKQKQIDNARLQVQAQAAGFQAFADSATSSLDQVEKKLGLNIAGPGSVPRSTWPNVRGPLSTMHGCVTRSR